MPISSTSYMYSTQMAEDVISGLSQTPKRLSSRYFYDDKGSEIFRQIMRMESYYPTDCEYEVFAEQTQDILNVFAAPTQPFRLIEFGAGDGLKTKLLLHGLLDTDHPFTYMPIDISQGAIDTLANDLMAEMPTLNFQAVVGEYFEALHRISEDHHGGHKVVLFLGSNIGNFLEDQAIEFLKGIAREFTPEDRVLIGFDLKKDPRVILNAYDDPEGITREFNLNLLTRFNRELGANFNRDKWMHYASYVPLTGMTKSYLLSKEEQSVHFEALNHTVKFEAWEPIWTELSQKYDIHMIESLAAASGFKVLRHFTDSREYFLNTVWALA